jgi:hypothetical protein
LSRTMRPSASTIGSSGTGTRGAAGGRVPLGTTGKSPREADTATTRSARSMISSLSAGEGSGAWTVTSVGTRPLRQW